MMAESTLWDVEKRHQRVCFLILSLCHSKLGRKPSSKPGHAGTLTLNFPGYGTVRNKCRCSSLPVCGILYHIYMVIAARAKRDMLYNLSQCDNPIVLNLKLKCHLLWDTEKILFSAHLISHFHYTKLSVFIVQQWLVFHIFASTNDEWWVCWVSWVAQIIL